MERFGRERPFRPFVVELIDGRRFRCASVEEYTVGRTSIAALDSRGDRVLISLLMIATITEERLGESHPAGGAA